MPPERPWHNVIEDSPVVLEALAAPFGTYVGVAACRPVPGARSLDAIATDLLWALGKTQVLTRAGPAYMWEAEVWLRAHDLRRLFVLGADGIEVKVGDELCELGDRIGVPVVFVSAHPEKWLAELGDRLHRGPKTPLRIDHARVAVQPSVGAALPDAGFPGLPAACAELLEPDNGARAQAIYDECLIAAFDDLPSQRLLTQPDADHAFRSALARTPDLDALTLATHALRAAGMLRGYDIRVRTDGNGVAFEDLLTADRLAQLGGLLSPEAAAAGILAGMSGSARLSATAIEGDGAWASLGGTWHGVPAQGQPLLRAWLRTGGDSQRAPVGAPPRPSDQRHRLLWRSPPPATVRIDVDVVDCRTFRRVGDPPMDWTRPPRPSRKRHGSTRSAPAG